jgi:hypothetical protein
MVEAIEKAQEPPRWGLSFQISRITHLHSQSSAG